MRIVVERMRAHEMGSGKFVPEMSIHGVDEEEFPMLIPIVPPRVCRSRTDCFHNFAAWMVPPHRAAEWNALLSGCSRNAHFPCTGCATAAVKPAIGPKSQSIGKGVMHIGRAGQPIQFDLGRTVRHIVVI